MDMEGNSVFLLDISPFVMHSLPALSGLQQQQIDSCKSTILLLFLPLELDKYPVGYLVDWLRGLGRWVRQLIAYSLG